MSGMMKLRNKADNWEEESVSFLPIFNLEIIAAFRYLHGKTKKSDE